MTKIIKPRRQSVLRKAKTGKGVEEEMAKALAKYDLDQQDAKVAARIRASSDEDAKRRTSVVVSAKPNAKPKTKTAKAKPKAKAKAKAK